MDEAWRNGTHLVALFNIRSGRSTKRQTSLLDCKTVQLKAENNQVYLSFDILLSSLEGATTFSRMSFFRKSRHYLKPLISYIISHTDGCHSTHCHSANCHYVKCHSAKSILLNALKSKCISAECHS
jgi:hypothetical protein